MLFNSYSSLVFPAAVALNMFSTTALLIVLTVLNYPELAADVAIAQGSVLAIVMGFSANARNLILADSSTAITKVFLKFRCVSSVPIVFIAFLLSQGLVQTDVVIAIVIIFRRCAEWLAELQLSERERSEDFRYAYRFVVLQSISFFLLISAFYVENHGLILLTLIFWTISPVLEITSFLSKLFTPYTNDRTFELNRFLPHIGSSWVIGVSTFIFRVLIVLLAGKILAGQVLSGYAIGGMLNAVYTYALGPSLVNARLDHAVIERKVTYYCIVLLAVLGIVVIYVANFADGSGEEIFLPTVGFSMIGGAIMILAQRRRIHVLQIQKGNVFVPDVLANILIIATVPFAFFLIGERIMVSLFLLNACITYVFYILPIATERIFENQSNWKLKHLTVSFSRTVVQGCIIFFLLLPVFIQLNGGIFDSTDMIFDSKGLLTRVPLPIAVFACFGGIALLIRFNSNHRSVAVVFGLFTLMALSTVVISTTNGDYQLAKFIFLVQVILPMFALFLGVSYVTPRHPEFRFEAVCLYVLLIIVPLEVLATLLQGTTILTPYLYIFSIYQHLQYVPVINVGLYFLALITLYETPRMRKIILFLAPFIGIYTSASISILAIFLLLASCAVVTYLLKPRGYLRFAFFVTVLSITSLMAYSWEIRENAAFVEKTGELESNEMPVNIEERMGYWRIYLQGITSSREAFLFGHERRPDRQTMPSAHNYYIDFVYNFGVIAILPFVYLITYTIYNLYKKCRTSNFPPDVLGLGLLVLFFVLVDNSLKVGFRQPYPGIIMFFLWGVLLNRISPALGAK